VLVVKFQCHSLVYVLLRQPSSHYAYIVLVQQCFCYTSFLVYGLSLWFTVAVSVFSFVFFVALSYARTRLTYMSVCLSVRNTLVSGAVPRGDQEGPTPSEISAPYGPQKSSR